MYKQIIAGIMLIAALGLAHVAHAGPEKIVMNARTDEVWIERDDIRMRELCRASVGYDGEVSGKQLSLWFSMWHDGTSLLGIKNEGWNSETERDLDTRLRIDQKRIYRIQGKVLEWNPDFIYIDISPGLLNKIAEGKVLEISTNRDSIHLELPGMKKIVE